MKAALQHKNGDPTSPDVLSVVDDAAVPEPAAGQVLVKVSCASVNPIDYKLVAGDFPGKKAGPFGCDVSGTIAKLGPGCGDAFKVGDRVYADAIKTPGSFAEYALVPAAALGRIIRGAQTARRRARVRADHGRRRRHRHGVHDAPHQGQARPHRVQAVGRPPRSADD